jgi:hypothetical protein
LDPRYNGSQPQGIQGVVREVGEVIGGMIRDPLARNIEPPPPRQGHAELPRYGGPNAVRMHRDEFDLCGDSITDFLFLFFQLLVRSPSSGFSRT